MAHIHLIGSKDAQCAILVAPLLFVIDAKHSEMHFVTVQEQSNEEELQ